MTEIPLEQEGIIFEGIAFIDGLFCENNIPLNGRPLKAAIQYVKIFLDEDSITDKEDFYNAILFAVIYHYSYKWYSNSYPAMSNKRSGKSAMGVILLRGIATQLEIPLTTRRVETEGESAWLLFPTEVAQNEAPLDWIINAPSAELLSEVTLAEVTRKIVTLGVGLRRIRTNLLCVEPDDTVVQGFCDGILPALETAANHILKNDKNHFQDAIWMLQMAYEKMLKAISYQKTGAYFETHDLFRLFDAISTFSSISQRRAIQRFPRQGDVMDARYGQSAAPSVQDIFELYFDAVKTVGDLSEIMERKLSVSNGGILIKRPPWTRFQTE